MTSNFLQFDAGGTNALSDADYNASALRTGGVVPGIASSALHNKLFLQTSTMCAAIAKAMSDLGYTVADNDYAALWANLTTIFTPVAHSSVANILTGTSTAVVADPDSIAALWEQGTDIASASPAVIPATGGGYFNITGTTGITGISQGAALKTGRQVRFKFGGALTLTHNATSFILPGAANISAAVGDIATFVCVDSASNYWQCVSFQQASGLAVLTKSYDSGSATAGVGSSTLTFAHGLGVNPKSLTLTCVCKTGEGGYSIGDEIVMFQGTNAANNRGFSVLTDATNVKIPMAGTWTICNKTAWTFFEATVSNWYWRVRAYA